MELTVLAPHAGWLAAGVVLDFVFGDPVYASHPVRLMGRTLSGLETLLRRWGWNGYGGGILLFLGLAAIWCGGICALLLTVGRYSVVAAVVIHILLVYSMVALRDLLSHAWKVEVAAMAADVTGARAAIGQLVGRDTSRMSGEDCRRAAVESLSENLVDGFVSALFWYWLAGIPGLLLFKIVSTMDSMVGYKTPRYLEFGWCGARLDDLFNWMPARLSWLLIGMTAFVVPNCSAWKALRIGWTQHSLVPGPNSGWSEATMAGALQRKLVGPIWANGQLVTEIWIGDAADLPLTTREEMLRAMILTAVAGCLAALLAVLLLIASLRAHVVPFV